jgi:hypothetical protein
MSAEQPIVSMENIPKPAERQEEKVTKVVLEFMRHGKKEADPSKPDEKIRLSEPGRAQADARGAALDAQPEVALAVGSQRERTQETAARAMLPEYVDADMTLEDIEAMIAEKSKHGEYGKKILEDPRLNFDITGPAGKLGEVAFKAGRYLQWVITESNQQAKEMHDTVSTTFARQAGNVAAIVRKYAGVGDAFQRIASASEKYEEYGNQLERYLGTHSGVSESFVAKVLEKVSGEEAKDEFLRSAGSGFAETKGIHVEIVNKSTDQVIDLSYPVTDENGEETMKSVSFTRDILDEIIQEREEFDRICAE